MITRSMRTAQAKLERMRKVGWWVGGWFAGGKAALAGEFAWAEEASRPILERMVDWGESVCCHTLSSGRWCHGSSSALSDAHACPSAGLPRPQR